jgi:hypothetical protein
MTSAGRWSCSIVAGHRHRLAGAGGAEQGLEALAGEDALGELLDRLGLVGRGAVDGVEAEVRHPVESRWGARRHRRRGASRPLQPNDVRRDPPAWTCHAYRT